MANKPAYARVKDGKTPLQAIIDAHSLRRDQVAGIANVLSRDIHNLANPKKMAMLTVETDGMTIPKLCRIASVLGVAPAELLPVLAVRPKGGFLNRHLGKMR